MNFDDLINETAGLYNVPIWMAVAIQTHHPRMTVQLAHSMFYKVKPIDKVLGTLPLYESIKVEVN